LISFGIFITGLLSVYLFNNLLLVAAGIFLIGCGFAVVEGTLSGLLSDVNPDETSKVMNISQMILSIGAVAGPFAALLLTDISGSWKVIFLLMIILFGLVLVYFTKLKFGGSISKVNDNNGLISLKLFKDSIFIFLCISIFIYVGIEEGVAFWLGTYFKDMYNAGNLGAYTLSGFWASMIIGRYLASRFYNKKDLFLKGGLIISLLFMIAALLLKSSAVANIICFAGVGLGFSAVWPIIISITADNYPKYTGTAMGIMMTFGAGGGIAIPFLVGLIANLSGIGTAFRVFPVLIFIILMVQRSFKSDKMP